MYGYIYIHIENYNEQFIFSTSISYHFYKGFRRSRKFFGETFRPLSGSPAIRENDIALCLCDNANFFLVARDPRGTNCFSSSFSFPRLHSERKKGGGGLFYNENTLSYEISPIRARAEYGVVLEKKERERRSVTA